MNRVIVAFQNFEDRQRVCDVLESEGIPVRYKCSSGAEVIRAVNKMGGGVIICSYKLTDMTANDLAHDLIDSALVLVVAISEQLNYCDKESIYKLHLPTTNGELLASVRILLQTEEKHQKAIIPQRNFEEEKLIERAKALLAIKNNMSEQEAHRYLQQKSMDSGKSKSEIARLIIETLDT